jgi:hypothetical protein
VYRYEQEPTWQMPLWTLVQDPHTDLCSNIKQPEMDPNVAVLHVDDSNFASGLLIFFLIFFFF